LIIHCSPANLLWKLVPVVACTAESDVLGWGFRKGPYILLQDFGTKVVNPGLPWHVISGRNFYRSYRSQLSALNILYNRNCEIIQRFSRGIRIY
jgi:hypothetical protein